MASRPRLYRYDWEGVFSADFTLESFQRRCSSLADALIAHAWSCLITYDTRFMSGQFARYAYQILEQRGVRVSYGAAPAPIPAIDLVLEQRRNDTAMIVSAGNRPFWYNGIIALGPFDTSPLLAATAEAPPMAFPVPPGIPADTAQIDLRAPYLDMLREAIDMDLIRRTTLTLFVDPMNGATSGYVPAALGEGSQTKAIEINRETDPLFGRQPPQPTEAGLNRLRKLVKESDSHLGVALSADGRAIAVTDNLGDLVTPIDLTLLLALYLGRQYRQRGAIVLPLPEGAAETPPAIRAWEDAHGMKVELSADPAARIAELLTHDRNSLLVGTTQAGEVTLGRYSATPDATLVALVLLEAVAHANARLRAMLDEMKGKA